MKKLMPVVPWRVAAVAPLENYALRVQFADGLEGEVRMRELILSDRAGVFFSLRDPDIFNAVFVESGAVTWPGDLDLAPDAMHDEIQAQGTWVLT